MEVIVPKTDYENPADTPYLLKDLIQGDEAVADRQDFQRLSDPEIQKGLQLILNNPCLSDSMRSYFFWIPGESIINLNHLR